MSELIRVRAPFNPGLITAAGIRRLIAGLYPGRRLHDDQPEDIPVVEEQTHDFSRYSSTDTLVIFVEMAEELCTEPQVPPATVAQICMEGSLRSNTLTSEKKQRKQQEAAWRAYKHNGGH